jgi:CBS domain-containing protein
MEISQRMRVLPRIEALGRHPLRGDLRRGGSGTFGPGAVAVDRRGSVLLRGEEHAMTIPETAASPETLGDDPPITRIMTSRMVAITPDSPLSTALRLMADAGVHHLPVLDEGRCVGVVTEADIARFVLGGPASFAARICVRVCELSRPTEPIPPTAHRSDAARRMRTERGDAVIVVDRGRLVGLVTTTDLVRSLAETTPSERHQGPTP